MYLKARAKSLGRRVREAWFPDSETRQYRKWLAAANFARGSSLQPPLPPGLLSLLTLVWDGSPPQYLQKLAQSISKQNNEGSAEWVVLDNGCRSAAVQRILQKTAKLPGVLLVRQEENIGIARGLRTCLERATNQYVVPVDADDELHLQALATAAQFIIEKDFPDALYSDEDKLVFQRPSQPYFKPDYDPVLLVNSAYIAHLGIVKRSAALEVGAYTDKQTEGSVDWDLFLRFAAESYRIEHIPAMLYSWRTHLSSTADSGEAKAYIAQSQKTALNRYLQLRGLADEFSVAPSPLFPGGAHFRLQFRRPEAIAPKITLPKSLQELESAVQAQAATPCVALLHTAIQVSDPDWQREAEGWYRLFPDTVMAGGLLRDPAGRVHYADEQLGFAGFCGTPNRGRLPGDAGYFGQLFKARSTGAVSSLLAVVNTSFLLETLRSLPSSASPTFLGAWLGAEAMRRGRRIVFSPFINGSLTEDIPLTPQEQERSSFRERYRDLLPDRRYYPRPFSLERGFSIASDELSASSRSDFS